MFASPTFVLTSGAMLALLLAGGQSDHLARRRALVDRALFLVTVGHLLVAIAHLEHINRIPLEFSTIFMTDTIGASILVGAYLVPQLSLRARAATAIALYVASWTVVLVWHPMETVPLAVKGALFGNIPLAGTPPQTFSLVPWFAIYLGGSIVGEYLTRAVAARALVRFATRLIVAGFLGVVAAALIKLAYYGIRPTAWPSEAAMPPIWHGVFLLTSPFDKYPPGPAYLLTYGGGGAIIAGLILLAAESGVFAKARAYAAVLGKASFVAFTAQFYLYYVLLPHMAQPNATVVVLYFLTSVAMLWTLAFAWERFAGNRYLTLGLRHSRHL